MRSLAMFTQESLVQKNSEEIRQLLDDHLMLGVINCHRLYTFGRFLHNQPEIILYTERPMEGRSAAGAMLMLMQILGDDIMRHCALNAPFTVVNPDGEACEMSFVEPCVPLDGAVPYMASGGRARLIELIPTTPMQHAEADVEAAHGCVGCGTDH